MTNSKEFIEQLSIQNLLEDESANYIIPMYQRNYAWEEGEITQLIQDVIDYMPNKQNYYIGTLVVFKLPDTKPTIYETIDGQQRLTTLSLLVSYLKNKGQAAWCEELKIHFESREHSKKTFDAIFNGKAEELKDSEINTAILNGYRLIEKILPLKLAENKITPEDFANYLFENVQIMRVKVPHDTDLNHYFEIMNSRGEQLEKHEILKAKMMEVLNKTECEQSQNCLHLVWEACANMEKYVQMGFMPKQRDAIFGKEDWGQFTVSKFDDLCEKLKLPSSEFGEPAVNSNALSLTEIIKEAQSKSKKNDKDDESPERFNSVINFPNFLLHVLRVFTEKDIPLDDKRLISTFRDHITTADDVKKFIFALLKCKYLFDQYIIKREFIKGTDGWSLKRLKWNDGGEKSLSGRNSYVNTFGGDDENSGENRKILMILSAFHVSTPTLVYKHWLNAALHHLYFSKEIKEKSYLSYLEGVARAFIFDRFLAANDGTDYFQIIYKNKGKCQATQILDESKLSFGNIQNNLIFNYLDYLLWLHNEGLSKKDTTISKYEFTFRSSVEHYYPQNPMPGFTKLVDEPLNSFGNLCLISHSKNSRLSNFMPKAKKDYYKKNTIDSVKQHLMMKDYEDWDENSIKKHYEEMKKILVDNVTKK